MHGKREGTYVRTAAAAVVKAAAAVVIAAAAVVVATAAVVIAAAMSKSMLIDASPRIKASSSSSSHV